MAQGTVDKYSEQRGLGYIIRDDGKLVFFEGDSLSMTGYKTVAPGDRVSFDVEKTIHGLEAKNVSKI